MNDIAAGLKLMEKHGISPKTLENYRMINKYDGPQSYETDRIFNEDAVSDLHSAIIDWKGGEILDHQFTKYVEERFEGMWDPDRMLAYAKEARSENPENIEMMFDEGPDAAITILNDGKVTYDETPESRPSANTKHADNSSASGKQVYADNEKALSTYEKRKAEMAAQQASKDDPKLKKKLLDELQSLMPNNNSYVHYNKGSAQNVTNLDGYSADVSNPVPYGEGKQIANDDEAAVARVNDLNWVPDEIYAVIEHPEDFDNTEIRNIIQYMKNNREQMGKLKEDAFPEARVP